jgi:hypothetical protein
MRFIHLFVTARSAKIGLGLELPVLFAPVNIEPRSATRSGSGGDWNAIRQPGGGVARNANRKAKRVVSNAM